MGWFGNMATSDLDISRQTSYSAKHGFACLEFAGPTWDLVLVDVVA
jgi:hypothetical protein